MLPALTARVRPAPRRRILALGASAVLALAAATSAIAPTASAPERSLSVADRLAPGTWGLTLPASWLGVPVVDLRPGDRIDVIAIRIGERSAATPIAFDLEVITSTDAGVVVGASAFDATALTGARAAGQLLVPLLRSTR